MELDDIKTEKDVFHKCICWGLEGDMKKKTPENRSKLEEENIKANWFKQRQAQSC